MTKRQNKSLIVKAIMLLLALIIMVFAGSLAWYSSNRTVSADGASVTTKTTQDFKMALGFKNDYTVGKQLGDDQKGYVVSEFTRHFNLRQVEIKTGDEIGLYDVFENIKPRDLTGDGITLVRPMLTSDNSAIDKTSASYSLGKQNEDYIAFDIFFQAASKCQIFLDNNTKVQANIEYNDGSLVSETDGTISSDAIVGSLRVAFTDYSVVDKDKNLTNEYSLVKTDGTVRKTDDVDSNGVNAFLGRTAPNALWIPRADIRYDDTVTPPVLYTDIANSQSANASYVSDGQSMNTYRHTYYSYDGLTGGYKQTDDILTSTITGLQKDDIVLCNVIHAGKDSEGKDCYYGKVHVKIWIEGCDSEARRVMNSGKFIMDLELLSRDI